MNHIKSITKLTCLTITAILTFFFNKESLSAASLDRSSETISQELNVDIRKRVMWTDESNGNAEITLQYASNSGELEGTEVMNVILIQDKSGSMDSNYGLRINLSKNNMAESDATGYIDYPILNDLGWSETSESFKASTYPKEINYRANGALSGWIASNSTEYSYQNPCQETDHYYFLINDYSQFQQLHFLSGNQLDMTMRTDLHHYVKLESKQEALAYIAEGRRIVRAKTYYDNTGTLISSPTDEDHPDGYEYFLDVSQILTIGGKEWLKTCPTECENQDRLRLSIKFMEELILHISSLNADNKIAYIPFWSDVPENGTWNNWTSDGEGGYYDYIGTSNEVVLNHHDGVGYCGLTSSNNISTLLEQNANSFTYNGTNWTQAFTCAKNILDQRTEEDLSKKTLIVFLTDGDPQGFNGRIEDYDDPSFNGGSALTEIKATDGVSIYACGVCLKEANTAVYARLNAMDSRGTASIIQTTADFEALRSDILTAIQENYVTFIYGKDSFYIHQMDDSFSLNYSLLDSTWKTIVLQEMYPQKIDYFQRIAAIADESTPKIYCRNNNTIYWYIGDMTTGDYSAPNHSITIPVKYTTYDTDTNGTKVLKNAGLSSKLVYYSSINPKEELTKTIDEPSLLFSRDALPTLTITQELKGGVYSTDQVYHYAYSTSPLETGTKPDTSLSISIPKGQSSGQVTEEGLSPGTYYLYKSNDSGEIIKSSETTVTLKQTALISTLSANSEIPFSATTSDSAILENEDNLLGITSTDGTVTYTQSMQTGNLTIQKTIDASEEAIWWTHGTPAFTVRISGVGIDGETYTFHHTFAFTEEYVRQHEKDGKVTMSYTFSEIPISSDYHVEELIGSRYLLSEITGSGENITISQKTPSSDNLCYSLSAHVNLSENLDTSCVTFYNKKTNYRNFSHLAYVENKLCKDS